MSDIAIKVENISKKYFLGASTSGNLRDTLANGWGQLIGKRKKTEKKAFWALQDVSFEVKKGEVIGVIGRNGAGKSTLLKILSRITEPTSGRIELNGRVASLLEVGTGFHPELSGRENIFLNGTLLGMTRAEIKRKFDEIIDFSGVEEFIDTPVKKYSSGMYVRLAFAVAAHLEPEILLIDEVLAVGDAEFQKKCLGKIDEVAKRGRTVIFVSHDMGAVENLCEKSIFLKSGIVDFFGDTSITLNKYLYQNKSKKYILNKAVYHSSSIKVHKFLVNQKPDDYLTLLFNERELDFFINFELFKRMSLSFTAVLYDMFGKQIGIFSPGHMNSTKNVFSLPIGKHHLASKIILPKLNKGTYYFSFHLANPGIEGYVNFENALELVHSGFPSTSGYTFEQGKNGYFLIEGKLNQ